MIGNKAERPRLKNSLSGEVRTSHVVTKQENEEIGERATTGAAHYFGNCKASTQVPLPGYLFRVTLAVARGSKGPASVANREYEPES